MIMKPTAISIPPPESETLDFIPFPAPTKTKPRMMPHANTTKIAPAEILPMFMLPPFYFPCAEMDDDIDEKQIAATGGFGS
jgi:hypothetical protein